MSILTMILESLKDPSYDQELLNSMKDFKYGVKLKNGKYITADDEKFDKPGYIGKHLQIMTPNEVSKHKTGTCWDQSIYQYDKLKKAGYNPSMVHFHDKNYSKSHTAVIYKKDGQYNWHENAWQKYRGIHKYEKKNDAINDMVTKFMADNPSSGGYYINKNVNADDLINKHMSAQEYIDKMTAKTHKYKH